MTKGLIEVFEKSQVSFPIQIVDENGDPINLTDMTVYFYGTDADQADGDPRIEKSSPSSGVVIDTEATGDITVTLGVADVELDVEGGYLADVGRKLRKTCLANGVLLRPLGNVLYALPPLRTSREPLEKIET